jgi:hypothetical protein
MLETQLTPLKSLLVEVLCVFLLRGLEADDNEMTM